MKIKHAYPVHLDPGNYYWATVDVWPSKTGRTFRCIVTGNPVPGVLTPPRTKRLWINRHQVNNNPTEAARRALWRSLDVQAHHHGQMLVSRCRQMMAQGVVSREQLKAIQHDLNEKWGRGWVYRDIAAQGEAWSRINQLPRKAA